MTVPTQYGVPQTYGSGPGQQPYFTPGAFKAFRSGIWAAIFFPVMLRIGKNWYNKTGDMKYSFGRSIIYSAMWKVLVTATFWWMRINAILASPDTNWFTAYEDGTPNNPTIIWICRMMQWVVLIALGVAYCKLVDLCMFKHRFMYKVFQPIRRRIDFIPWVVLISLVLLPVFFYIQMAVVQVPDASVSLR